MGEPNRACVKNVKDSPKKLWDFCFASIETKKIEVTRPYEKMQRRSSVHRVCDEI